MINFIKKIGKKSEEIREINLKKLFKNEDEMRDWFAQNLSNIIPTLIFLDIEYLIGKKIPDTIALNPGNTSEKPSFVIIEYKLNDKNKIEQVIGYRGKITDANKIERKKLMAKAWEKHHKQKQEYEALGNLDYYNWEETKIILVNSEFEDWVVKLAENKKNGIILGKIGAIQSEKDCLYINIEGRDGKVFLLNRKKKKVNGRNNEVQKITNNEYQKTWKKETSEWIEKETHFLQNKFPLLSFIDKKNTGTDIKLKGETIATIAWKNGLLNQPKFFLVDPSSLLRGKFKKIFYSRKSECHVYLISSPEFFEEGHSLLNDFIKEKD